MDSKCQEVDEQRAACLLGFTADELRRFSRLSGFGHVEKDDAGEHMVFSYEDLRRICLMVTAAASSD